MNDSVSGAAFPVPRACVNRPALLLARIGLFLLDRADDALAPAGIDAREYLALAVLDDDAPGSQLELAQLLRKAPAMMVAVVDELEQRGLVERTRDPADRRRTVVTPTARGRKALARADELVEALFAETLAGLGDDDRAALHALLLRGVGLGVG